MSAEVPRETARLIVALAIIVALSVLTVLDKIDASVLSALLGMIIGYYFGKYEATLLRLIRGKVE